MESMKDFEQEIKESLENMKEYNDPDSGKWEIFEKMLEEKTVSRVKIVEVVKVGCVAFLDEVRAFIPASQLSLKYVEDLEVYLNKSLDVVLINVEPEKKRLVLSHKEIEKQQEDEAKKEKLSKIKVGDIITGKVDSIKDYGAFISLDEGVDGLLHISQISHNRIKHPGVLLNVGDEVKVKVIGMEEGRISLSKKALEEETARAEEKRNAEHFKYEEKGRASTSLAGLLKDIKL
ncbi:MAG: S1 RNA-binding domain-containing protein [Johnsonella sp.]|nr:S1 RNA-binding domain-containing protein [Johnsonella sp.]